MDKDDNYMYGDDKRSSREERDPRKRKRQSSEMVYDVGDSYEDSKGRGRSRSRDRGGFRRGKSRSGSPDNSYRKGGSGAREDEWKKKSEAFLQKLNVAPPSDPRLGAQSQGYPGQQQNYQGYPGGYPSGAGYNYPPQGSYQGYAQPGENHQDQRQDSDRRDDRRGEWDDKHKDEKRSAKDRRRDDSVSSDEGGRRSKQGRVLDGTLIKFRFHRTWLTARFVTKLNVLRALAGPKRIFPCSW